MKARTSVALGGFSIAGAGMSEPFGLTVVGASTGEASRVMGAAASYIT